MNGAWEIYVSVAAVAALFWRKCLGILIRAGANFEAAHGHADNTPLRCAVLAHNEPAVALLLAAGCDADQSLWSAAARVGDAYDVLLLLLAAGVDPPTARMICDDAVGIESARQTIQRVGLDEIRERAFEICLALQSLRLPALQTVLILTEACAPFAAQLDFHRLWNLVVKVKHFQRTT